MAIQYDIHSGVVILRVATEAPTQLRAALCAIAVEPAALPGMPLLLDLRDEPPDVRYENVRWRVRILAQMRAQLGPRSVFLTDTGPVREGIGRMFVVFSSIEGPRRPGLHR